MAELEAKLEAKLADPDTDPLEIQSLLSEFSELSTTCSNLQSSVQKIFSSAIINLF